MKRTNLLRKSINLALSILVAGSIVAVGADGTTLASIFDNNNAIIIPLSMPQKSHRSRGVLLMYMVCCLSICLPEVRVLRLMVQVLM